jgi:hypothetical protein
VCRLAKLAAPAPVSGLKAGRVANLQHAPKTVNLSSGQRPAMRGGCPGREYVVPADLAAL